ncbi:MAG: WecB/TagA/CpsF family glycosyltransferase [Verrucomicrobiota bacterium]
MNSGAIGPGEALEVIGTPLQLTDYASFIRQCHDLSRQPRVSAVEFCNTQIVTMRRQDAAFREMTKCIDFFVPDGMPLIWCLNRRGAKLKDRVYGPTFMRQCISESPAPFSHYFLGGSPECGTRLRAAIEQWNPAVKIVGSFHGKCEADGRLEGAFDESVVREINEFSPDFIWIGFGTPKQQAWINRHKTQIRRGILLSVGFAFDVNAGTKKDAPLWMQRHGLTWVFRLLSEPRRLLSRYVRYNSLFLFYLLRDSFRSRRKTFP